MRLATARDELAPLVDPRVARNRAYLVVLLLSRVVTRLGSRKADRVRVRLIASTRDPLEGRVREGRFSRELLQRLEAVSASLPPLSERPEDIAPIARHCAALFGSRRGVTAVSEEALLVLGRHTWPRNVAELVDCMQHACSMATRDTIAIQDFVDLADINPIFFNTPYYLEPMKGGTGAYALLRDVLAETGKAGIAKADVRRHRFPNPFQRDAVRHIQVTSEKIIAA